MKVEQTLQDHYLDLVEKVAAMPAELLQSQAAEFGRSLARADLPPEALIQLHQEALQHLNVGEERTFNPFEMANLLGALFTGYCQSLREHHTAQFPRTEHPDLENRFNRAFQSGPLVILISRIRDDLIIDVNERFLQVFGYSRHEVVGHTTLELGILIDPNERARAVWALRETGKTRDFEARMRTKSGEERIFLTSVETDEFDGEPCFMRMGYDITERKQSQDQLLADAIHDAFHDSLTGLPNRALFMDRLDRSVERAKRHANYSFAVFFIDIDDLKSVNDSFGHMAGDQLLKIAADRLQACIATRDTVARLSGDEFAILLDDADDASDALQFADLIQKELGKPLNLNGDMVFTSVSIGIALSASGYEYPEQVLRDADKAMYRAKAQGRGQHEVHDPDIHAQAVARLKMKTDMLLTFERRGFHVNYQPIVDLSSGTITGFEALGRWQHPDRGLVSPVEFIPVAEETGLIIDIGRWMLREACEQIRIWQERFPATPPLEVSVNLCSKEFSQPDLIPVLEEILRATGLDASRLRIEITEGVIMEAPDGRTAILSDLRALGVKVHIDDFGTGQSSLSFMYQFPIDALKIARSFIHRIGPLGENTEVVRTIVLLARDFGMQVIAEGIETSTQLEQLRKLKCRYGQGFYFSQPLDRSDAEALLATAPQW